MSNGNGTTDNVTDTNARLVGAQLNKTSELQVESPPALSATVDPSIQRTRELLRQRLERVKQGIIE